jgi:hypothetical protein
MVVANEAAKHTTIDCFNMFNLRGCTLRGVGRHVGARSAAGQQKYAF